MRTSIFSAAPALALLAACAERPNFSQDEIGDPCYRAADCGTSALDTGDYGVVAIQQGDYDLAPLTFRLSSEEDTFECVEHRCCLPDSDFDPVYLTYYPRTQAYYSDYGALLYQYCESNLDCCATSHCAKILNNDSGYTSFECRPTCESGSDCPSEICTDGVCAAPNESVVSGSTVKESSSEDSGSEE